MPDLSHRPTRYAVTAIAAVALVAGALTSLDVRVGQDADLARAQRVAADLQEQVDRSEADASASAADASATSVTATPTGAASATTAATGAGRPAPAATTVIRQVVAGTQGGTAARAATTRASASPTTAARTAAGTTSCLTQPDQESAQAVFASDRTRYAAWDGDGDGRACEQLKSRGTTTVKVVGEPAAPPQEVPAKPTPSSTASPSTSPSPSSTSARPSASPTTTRPPAVPGPTTPALPVVPAASEIIAAGHFFGLATATTEEADVLEAALGRQVTMSSFYKGWDTDYDTARVTAAWQRGQVPVMTWESRPLEHADDTTDYSLARIVDGDFDDYLYSYARQVDALGLPVVIRFDHEMNGDWYRWTEALDRVGGTNAYGNAPGSYVAAWQHVHDVFEAAGAGDEVIWTWSPNRVDNIGNARFRPMSAYYPGDEYVDWVGMTGYYRPEDVNRHQAPTFAGTFTRTLDQLRALAPGKHILIAEMGATEDGNNKPAWTASFFTGLAAQPDVVGFTWFNYAISEKGHTNDWRLDSTDEVFAAAKAGLATSQYGLDVGKRFTLKPIGVSEPPEETPAPSSTSPSSTDSPTSTPAPSTSSSGTSTTTPSSTTTPTSSSTTATTTSTATPTGTGTSTGSPASTATPVITSAGRTARTASATPTTAP